MAERLYLNDYFIIYKQIQVINSNHFTLMLNSNWKLVLRWYPPLVQFHP